MPNGVFLIVMLSVEGQNVVILSVIGEKALAPQKQLFRGRIRNTRFFRNLLMDQ